MGAISFTPVRVDPETLGLHLAALDEQGLAGHLFYDDNTDPDSSELLAGWVADRDHAKILPTIPDLPSGAYRRGDDTHDWSPASVARVAMIKNRAIFAFLSIRSSGLVLIDADVIPAPRATHHLASAGLPILSGIYWTKWKAETEERPNVWDQHPARFRDEARLSELREPGHHQVGGLGAWTYISREVLETGLVNFNTVRGITYQGEDRHFCIRAAVLEIPLTACSHVEAFHVYRPSEIANAKRWWHEIHQLSG